LYIPPVFFPSRRVAVSLDSVAVWASSVLLDEKILRQICTLIMQNGLNTPWLATFQFLPPVLNPL
jgi:hypothetical protein